MKRSLCVFVLILFLFVSFSSTICAFAEELGTQTADPAVSTQNESKDSLSYTCTYDSEGKKVTVSGTMDHSAFAQHEDSTLEIYSIPPGSSEAEISADPEAQPLASADVSLRFSFTFKVADYLDKYSRYAVFLRSPDGTLTLGTEAQFPEVTASIDDTNGKESFKGIYDTSSPSTLAANAGSAVIPVYLDRLFTEDSGGYIFQLEGQHLFFSKKYIDELDSKVNSYSLSGAKVHLQLLLDANGSIDVNSAESAIYCLPNVYDDETVRLIHSAVEFLAQRYSAERGGRINGFILGKAWDSYLKYNYISVDTFDTYVEMCGFYAVLVANSARSIDPAMDIVLPFSAENFKEDQAYSGVEGESYSVKAVMDGILAYFDNVFTSGINCSFLIETSEVPFGITNEDIESGVDFEYDGYESEIYPAGQKAFSEYLNTLSKTYSGISERYIFLWIPPHGLSGNALASAYAYAYYSLLSDSSVSSFVTEFSTRNSDTLESIRNTVKYINTEKSDTVTSELLKYFDAEERGDVRGILRSVSPSIKPLDKLTPSFSIPAYCRGSFAYLDPSKTVMTEGWYRGNGCKSIQTAYDIEQHKAIKAELAASVGYCEVLYEYEHYEDVEHTPYLSFDIKIDDNGKDSLYEVSVCLKYSEGSVEALYAAQGGERVEAVLDISEYDRSQLIEGLKITVRRVYGEADGSTLWLYGFFGHSEELTSGELEKLIEAERDKIKHIDEETEEDGVLQQITVIAVLAILTGALGFGLFVTFRKGTKAHRKDE